MTAVREVDPADRRALKDLVRLERTFLGENPLFVPPPEHEIRRQLSGRSAFFDGVERVLLVASNGGDVARCAALVNPRWQSSHADPGTGFVGYFAAAPGASSEVSEMLERAETWLAERGVTRVVAPFNASAMLGMGLLTDAFEESPMFPLPWHPPYYSSYVEAAGYRPRYPLFLFEVDLESARYREFSARIRNDPQCTVRPLDRKNWDADLRMFLRLFNAGFRDEWEMQQFTIDEFRELWAPLRRVLDPRLFLFAEVDGEPAGFCVGFPDWTPLFRSLHGKFGPLQAVRFLRRAKRFDRAGVTAIALLPEYRGRHIGATLATEFYGHLEDLGVKRGVYYLVNEVNASSRALAEAFGGRGRIIYHCYEKQLG